MYDYQGYVFKDLTADISKINEEGRRLLDNREVSAPVVYVPMCFAEVVWNLVGSVQNGICIMKIDTLKPINRALNTLRGEYEKFFYYRGIPEVGMNEMKLWSELFLDHINGANALTMEIKKELEQRYAELEPDWKAIVIGSYVAYVFVKALIYYSDNTADQFCRKLGTPGGSKLFPDSLYALPNLLISLAGDKTIPREILNPHIDYVIDLIDGIAEESTEPAERTQYRTSCLAYRLHGGCKAMARKSTFGCYASSKCRRMMNYDSKHCKK